MGFEGVSPVCYFIFALFSQKVRKVRTKKKAPDDPEALGTVSQPILASSSGRSPLPDSRICSPPRVHGYGWGFTTATMVSGNVFYRDVAEVFTPRGKGSVPPFFAIAALWRLDMLFYSILFLV